VEIEALKGHRFVEVECQSWDRAAGPIHLVVDASEIYLHCICCQRRQDGEVIQEKNKEAKTMIAKLAVPNAILFVLDPTNEDAIIPEYKPGETAAATLSCVSIATIADVDGEVTVQLCTTSDNVILFTPVQVFAGLLETPGCVLAVVTSEFDRVLEIATDSTTTQIIVRVDDDQSIVRVSIEANFFQRLG
jgi:hypothetical protein